MKGIAKLAIMFVMLKNATMTPMYLRETKNLVVNMRLKFPNNILNDASNKSFSRSMSPYLFQSTFFMLEKILVMPLVAVFQVLSLWSVWISSSCLVCSSLTNTVKVPKSTVRNGKSRNVMSTYRY